MKRCVKTNLHEQQHESLDQDNANAERAGIIVSIKRRQV